MAATKISDHVKQQIINDKKNLSIAEIAKKYDVSYASAKRFLCPEWYASQKKRRAELRNDPVYQLKRTNECLKYLYGISLEDYRCMLKEQNDKCACCGRKETEEKNGKTKRFCIDHNHKTGQIRGLLCHRCNRMIGSALENTQTLKNAIVYLDHYGKKDSIHHDAP